MLLEAT